MMKKMLFLFCLIIFLSGCATYKFHYGQPPDDKGYVVSRDDYTILEYTLGKDNRVPRLQLAQERFKRRRKIIEHYYKKMGYIENRFKQNFWNPPIYFLKFVGGIFRFPFIAISEYKYEHNPEYREKIKKLEEEQTLREETRINNLKKELDIYIQQDLARESPETGENP